VAIQRPFSGRCAVAPPSRAYASADGSALAISSPLTRTRMWRNW
jgi:hypothetical protein